jgi:hypothetical protein
MKTRHHFLPIEDARPGMIISAAMQVAEHGYLSMTLPAGQTLTQENLNQLIAHHAEFVDVDLEDQRTNEQIAVDTALSARRLLEIFAGADLSVPHMAAFFDQILVYRSA